ncbi:E3 ubiquitin-protein ligase HECW1 [Armadillidium vulgare]|nr:E3 ubiquitin-protein ligase HECW1 [Armadillidium vulgare]
MITACSEINPTFNFIGAPSDVLELKVKDKGLKSRPVINKFLGQISIPVAELLNQARSGVSSLVFPLESRTSSESVSGQICFDLSFSTAIPLIDESDELIEPNSRDLSSGVEGKILDAGDLMKSSFKTNKQKSVMREKGITLCNGIDSSCNKSNGAKELSNAESDYSPIWNYSCEFPKASVKFDDCQDKDEPPPLPPRTKSLRDSTHRPLERSMAVQLGGPLGNSKGNRPPPLPPADRHSKPMSSTGSSISRSSSSGDSGLEPSVRPKNPNKRCHSSKSADSEWSSSSTSGVDSKTKPSSFDSLSNDVGELEEESSQGDKNSHSDSSVCMQANDRTYKGKDDSGSLDFVSGKDPTDVCVAPLATPEQDSSLQEAISETCHCDLKAIAAASENLENEGEVSSHSSCASSIFGRQSCSKDVKESQNKVSELISSPQCSSNVKLHNFCANNLCLPLNKENELNEKCCLLNSTSCNVGSLKDETITKDVKKNFIAVETASLSPPSKCFNLNSDIKNVQSSSDLISPTNAPGGSEGREGRSSGSESVCMVNSVESSSSSSVFASPSNETEEEWASAIAVDATSRSSADQEDSSSTKLSSPSCESSQNEMSNKNNGGIPRTPDNSEEIPPAVPPHKPHHKLLKALVCPPTPTHHAKPQPPERTTSDRREKDLKEEKCDKDRSLGNSHPKLSRQPSLKEWLKRYPKVEVAFDDPLPAIFFLFVIVALKIVPMKFCTKMEILFSCQNLQPVHLRQNWKHPNLKVRSFQSGKQTRSANLDKLTENEQIKVDQSEIGVKLKPSVVYYKLKKFQQFKYGKRHNSSKHGFDNIVLKRLVSRWNFLIFNLTKTMFTACCDVFHI